MRTNIDLDDALIAEGLRISGLRTKKDLVHKALEEFIESRRRRDIRELRGRVSFRSDYDHKQMRRGEPVDPG